MSDRRRQLLDAAITVLGTRGLRRLTHRAVDAEAGLPAGSTSNNFRTRDALIDGVLDRLVEVETAVWLRLAGPADALTADTAGFADVVARTVRELAGPARTVTLARHALLHEAAFHPRLQAQVRAARERLARWGVPLLARLGSPDPAGHHLALLGLVDGLLSNELAAPTPDFDPAPAVRAFLRGIAP